MRRRAPLGLGPRQNQVDKNPVFLERIVEQRQPAVAVAKKAEHRRHSLDGIFERGRDVDLRRPQYSARIDQILQHLQLQRRAARQVPAIRQDLNRQLALEALEHSGQARLEPAQHRHAGDQAFERPHAARSGGLPRRGSRQMTELSDEAR